MAGDLFERTVDVPFPRLGAVLAAVGLTLGGIACSFVASFTLRPTVDAVLGGPFPNAATLLAAKSAQIGFGVFLAGLLLVAGRDRIRQWNLLPTDADRPWLAALAWTLGGALGLELAAEATTAAMRLVGLPLDVLSGGGGLDVGLSTWPLLWPVVFLGLYLAPAFVEETFFRGLVQERLRDGFGPIGAVLLAAALFTFGHGFYGLFAGPTFLLVYFSYLFPQGLVWCVVYERTDALLVVAAMHALSWTELTLLSLVPIL